MSNAPLSSVIVGLSVVTDDELAFFAERLNDVPDVLARLETIKLYGHSRSVDIASAEVKSTKKTTTPDIVDLGAIDHTVAIQMALHRLVQTYEETVLITVIDGWGKPVQAKTQCPNRETDTMITYLLSKTLVDWMRMQQDFDDDIVEVLEVIQRAENYTLPRKVAKESVNEEEQFAQLPVMANKFRDSIYDYPMTVTQVVNFLKLKKYNITADRVRQWVVRDKLKPEGMVGKRPGYLPSHVIDLYNEMVTKQISLEKVL